MKRQRLYSWFFLMLLGVMLTFCNDLTAQTSKTETIAYPSQDSLYSYLNSRVKSLQEKILLMCRDSAINAHSSTEFTQILTKRQVLMRGADFFLTEDSFDFTPMPLSELKGFLFVQKLNSDMSSNAVSGQIIGLALLKDDPFEHLYNIAHPVVWLQWKELKNTLGISDFQFINFLAHFCSRIASPSSYNYSKDLAFEDMLMNHTLYYGTDSSMLWELAGIINNGKDYINTIRYNEQIKAGISKTKPIMVYKVSTKDSVNIQDAGKEISYHYTVVNAQSKIDTVKTMTTHGFVCEVSELIYDNQQLTAFSAYAEPDSTRQHRYIIPSKVYTNIESGTTILWFLEDYCRWYIRQRTPIKKK